MPNQVSFYFEFLSSIGSVFNSLFLVHPGVFFFVRHFRFSGCNYLIAIYNSQSYVQTLVNLKFYNFEVLKVSVVTTCFGQYGHHQVLSTASMWMAVGFEVLTVMIMKNSIFCDISPYISLKTNRTFWGTCFISASWFLDWLVFRPWTRRRHVPPKRRLIFNGLHGIMTHLTIARLSTIGHPLLANGPINTRSW
jgi:hypothetical protein